MLFQELGLDRSDGKKLRGLSREKKLTYLANERCALLLAMDPKIEERRIQLNKENETLRKGLERLDLLAQESSHEGV